MKKIIKIITKPFARLALSGGLFIVVMASVGGAAHAAGARCYFPGAATIPAGIADCSAYGPEVASAIQSKNGDINNSNLCYKLVIQNNAIGVEGTDCKYAPFTEVSPPSVSSGVTTTDTISTAKNESGISRSTAVKCDGSPSGDLQNCLTNENPLVWRFNQLVNILSIGIGVVVVIMIIIGGIQYITAGSNPQAVSAAKKRILNAIIALVAFILLFSFMQWLIPGGLF